MDKIEYNGQVYLRTNSKWTNDRHIIVHESLQKILNSQYIESADFSKYSVDELINEGDKFKESFSYEYAIVFYEKAIVNSDKKKMQYILPRITSCYRKRNMARKAIELFSYAKGEYGESVITPVLLTSVAAAYCDLREYKNAMRCCNWSYKKFGGCCDSNFQSVYERIKKESGIE